LLIFLRRALHLRAMIGCIIVQLPHRIDYSVRPLAYQSILLTSCAPAVPRRSGSASSPERATVGFASTPGRSSAGSALSPGRAARDAPPRGDPPLLPLSSSAAAAGHLRLDALVDFVLRAYIDCAGRFCWPSSCAIGAHKV
jgi:hypothetical protein